MPQVNLIIILIAVASLAGFYGIFQKAGEKGWKALVPVYNFYIWLKILKKPGWWTIIFLIPGVGYMMVMVMAGITSLQMQKKKELDVASALVLIPVELYILFSMLPSVKNSMLAMGFEALLAYITYSSVKTFLSLTSSGKKADAGGENMRMIVCGILFFISLPYYGFSKLAFTAPLPGKKEKEKRSVGKEWAEALSFAVIAATIIRTFFLEAYTIPSSSMEKSLMIGDYLFVSKADYGARIPMTPLSFPFAHNSLPGTRNAISYLDWLKYPYLRLPGFTHIKRHDIVVFNFPDGDTVCSNPGMDNPGYYAYCRDYGRDFVLSNGSIPMPEGQESFGKLIIRPVDKEENYIKRCIGTPGDTLLIRHAQVYINGKADEIPGEAQFAYSVTTADGDQLPQSLTDRLDITETVYSDPAKPNSYLYILTRKGADIVRQSPDVVSVIPVLQDSGKYDREVFPFSADYKWNVDNFGPLFVPNKGAVIKLDTSNLHLYRRIITAYEHNMLEVKGADIYINGSKTDHYTFKMNYYFMMGDNRHRSEDSRYWGFVPDDHVVGKASFIWMSIKENTSFAKRFRWKRFFTFINTEGLSSSYFIPGLLIIFLAIVYFYIAGRRRFEKKE